MQPIVLLVEQDRARGKRLEFLLRLAGYQVRYFASVEEAINWRTTCSVDDKDDICLLLGTPGPALELATLLQQLHTRGFELPVLLVNRAPSPVTTRFDERRQLACLGVRVCEPTEISAALADIFTHHRVFCCSRTMVLTTRRRTDEQCPGQ